MPGRIGQGTVTIAAKPIAMPDAMERRGMLWVWRATTDDEHYVYAIAL